MITTLEQFLQTHFFHTTFRPGQREIVEAIVEGCDVVALMPTGGGKSLCYQLPALMSDKPTLVISPLIALMKDQVDALNARGIAATYINSSIDFDEMCNRMEKILNGEIKIVYVAPERLNNPVFRAELAKMDLFMVAIDEAHCVSAWGHDFRPDYLLIHEFIRLCTSRPVVAAFTATATPEVKDDIIERLHLKNPAVFVRGFDRPNLKFFVRGGVATKHRNEEALRIIKSTPGATVAYTLSRKHAEELADYLTHHGVQARAYHAGMPAAKRAKTQEDFMENRFKVIVATVAFGMGVDKADIRLVIHVGVPASLEGYYQEAGRAGRDGEVAYCIVIPSGKDTSLHQYFIRKGAEEMDALGKPYSEIQRITAVKYDRLDQMKQYVESTTCRRLKILTYFSDPDLARYQGNCNGCDVCMQYAWKEIKRTKQKEKNSNELTGTIQETISLYQQGQDAHQIAKIRGLGVSTIFGHLLKWYVKGGAFDVSKYVSVEDEELIKRALAAADPAHRLVSAKARLPERISYEMVRMVMVKRGRGR